MNRLDQAAQLLTDLRQVGSRPVSLPAQLTPRDESEAYQIQRLTLQRLNARVGGWKVSMADADTGTAAPVFAADVYASPASLARGYSTRIGIEPEIAFTLKRALPPPEGRPYELAEVLDAIDSAHAAIEIVISRFQTHEGATPLDRLADNISNGGLVVGPAISHWRELALSRLPLLLTLQAPDGTRREQSIQGGHPLNDPIRPLWWLANQRLAHGMGLQAGEVITTGSCAGLQYIEAGGQAIARFEGLGSAVLATL